MVASKSALVAPSRMRDGRHLDHLGGILATARGSRRPCRSRHRRSASSACVRRVLKAWPSSAGTRSCRFRACCSALAPGPRGGPTVAISGVREHGRRDHRVLDRRDGLPPNSVSAKAWPSRMATGVSARRSVTSPTAKMLSTDELRILVDHDVRRSSRSSTPAFSRPRSVRVRRAADGEHDLIGVERCAVRRAARRGRRRSSRCAMKMRPVTMRMPLLDVAPRPDGRADPRRSRAGSCRRDRRAWSRRRGPRKCRRTRRRCSRRRRSRCAPAGASRSKASLEVMACSSPGELGEAQGVPPVAMRILPAVSVRPDSASRTVLGPMTVARSSMSSAPSLVERCAIEPPRGARSPCPWWR